MTRDEQILKACDALDGYAQGAFLIGAQWADAHPADHNFQKILFEGHEHNVCLTALKDYHQMQQRLEALEKTLLEIRNLTNVRK